MDGTVKLKIQAVKERRNRTYTVVDKACTRSGQNAAETVKAMVDLYHQFNLNGIQVSRADRRRVPDVFFSNVVFNKNVVEQTYTTILRGGIVKVRERYWIRKLRRPVKPLRRKLLWLCQVQVASLRKRS